MATKPKGASAKGGKRKGASANECGTHLDLSRVRVVQLVNEGVLPRHPDGSFDLATCRVAYIRYLRSEERRGSKVATASRLQEVRAKEVEQRMLREANKLVPLEAVQALVADVVGTFRYELTGVPAAASRDLAVRDEIEKHLNDAVDRCRRRFDEAGDALRAGREVMLEGEETDAG